MRLVPVSARTPAALDALLARLAAAAPDADFADLAFTLAAGRGHFEERAAVVAATPAELADRLRELAAGREVPGAWRGGARPDRADAVIQRGLAAATVAGLSSRAVDPVAYREALELLAALYVKGAEIDWFALHAGEAPRRIPLPLYPFARERYWFAAAPAAVRAAPDAAPDPAGRVLRGDEPFLRDHRVGGVPVVPGVAYLGWLRAAAGAGAALRQVAWLRPLGVPAPLEVRVVERAGPAGTRRLVVVRPDGTEHAEATVAAAAPAPGGILPHAEIRARCPEELPGDAIRARCAAAGLELGPTMAALRTVWAGADEVLAYLVRPAGATDDGWDPALLDGALQATAALGDGEGGGLPVPFALEAVTLEALPAEVWAHVVRRPAAGGLRRFDVRFATTEGRVLGTLEGLAMRPLRAGPPDAAPAVSAAAVAAEAVAPVDAPAAFLAWLTERFAEQVKLPPARLRPDDALEKFGLDSLMVTDFTRRLEESFGELPKTLLFEHQTLGELAAHLRTAHPGRVAALIAPAPGRALPRAIGAPTVVAAPVPGPAVPAPVGRADDIAIIGVAGRYPDAPDLDAFWRNLRAGRDSIIEIPPDRWDHRVFHDPRPGQPGKTRNKWGGFLPDVARFDAAFFGVTPREAIALDPQERIFLETAWQTLESAGYSRPALARRPVGVFVGVMYGEYQLHGAGDPATGGVLPLSSSYASIANRVSYFFNWHGPSLAVDTMCSSSLAAIHLACAALQRGEAELALAGGVNVTVHPHKDMLLAPGGFAAGDGRCRSFGAGGDGYVPGEGVGAVLLKPLAQAVADGDHIWGVIRASALNHGGKTNGYTVPNPKAQADVVGAALRRGGVAPDAVSYVEAHGTGTALGDPIEVAALARAFGDEAGAPEGHACLLGSVKSNIGHLEGAAGVAGLTKVLLQLRHAEIAPSLHSRALNPNIPFERTRFRVPQAVTAWPAGVAPRTAGVSSFGAGGANAHLIVSEAPPRDPAPAAAGPALIVLSARTADRLRAVAARLAAWLAEAAPADLRLTDVAFTLAAGREALDERLALFAADLADLRAQLAPFAAGGEVPAGGWRGRRREEPESPPPADAAPETIAAAWVSGTEIDWAGCLGSGDGRRIPLPGYPFAGERFWAPDRITRAADAPSAPPPPTASGLLLAPRWQPLVEAGDAAGPTPAGRGLVFDADPRLAAELARLFPQVSFTRVAPAGAAPAPGVVALGAEDEAGYDALVAAGPPALVVHHWATVSAGEPDPTSGLLSLVRLVRAVLRRSPAARLNVVFCHPPGCPEHEGVGGWARSLIREHPGIVVSLLEAPAPSVAAVARRLADRAPRQVRLTAAGAEELGLAELTPPAGTVLVRGGVYLITGGAGGLGRLLAPHLAARWGARIVLAGRSARGPEQEALVAAVRAAGGDARYVAADVATAAGAAAAVAAAREAFGRLDGVFHAAGVLRDRALRMKPPADYVAVAAPKLAGAYWLDQATAADALACFTLFSSTTGVFGNAGQADYAYANAALDAFAEARAARVRAGERSGATVALAWPWWRDGGMPAAAGTLERLAAAGLEPLPTATGLEWIEQLAGAPYPRLVALWGRPELIRAHLLQAPPPESVRPAAAAGATPASAVAPAPASAPELADGIERYLREVLGGVIQLEPDQLDPDQRFEDLGVDSIVVNDVNARLEREVGALPKTLLFEHPNLRRLARHLATEHAAAFARLAGPAAPASPEVHAAAAAPVVTVEAAPAPVTAVAAASGDIAIIGVAGRYPGAENLEDFWRLLREGREAVTEVPAERWDVNAFHDPDPARAIDGKSYGRWGAFLRDVDRFDPLFFHLSPVEAEMMDPQERLFLEVAWHALEDAGWTRRDLARARRAEYAANVGVFAGVTSNPYALLGHPGGGHAAPTSLPWSLANRVSYLFNFNGPSLPVDTACSSSLTAIHLAVQAIRRGECQQALAGGVNLYLHPAKFSHLSLMQMLSRDGHCRAFGAGADGFVPGEGCGVVLLKPLALARADGDRIHGVIRATAVNHGGRTNGYTVPSPIAQAELVGRALREGGVEPASVSYIEAHGTGTALGDPVEVEGLARAFTGGRPATPWCALGSVKANIGHLESAAGMAGLTKVLLQFRHRELVPSLHAEPPNPRINFAVTPFRVPHRVEAWTSVGPRRAGISSFGAGGANAHVIVEEPPAAPPAPPAASAAPQVIVLSARTRDRLQASAGRLADFLAAAEPPPSLAEVAWTLQVGREAREERVAWVATDHAGLLATLRALAADEEPAGVALVRGRVRRERLAAEGAEAPGVEVREPHAAAARWAAGEEILWAALHATPARRIGLPGYPFARERCWLPLPPAVPPAPAPEPAAAPVPAAGETTFTIADARLRDHRVQGRPVLPGAVALELLRRPPGGPPAGELRRITWARPVAGDDAVTVRGRWRPAGEGWTLELTVPADEALLVQAHAVAAASLPPASDPDHAARCPEEVPGAGLYAAFAARGIDYGPAFQVLTRIRRGPDTALAELALPAAWPAGTPALPAYVDGALQALAVLGAGDGGLEVPFALDAYAAADAPVPTRAVAEVTRRAGGGDGITRYDVVLRGPDGAWVASLRGVGLRPVAAEPVAETLLLRPTWKPAPPLPPAPAGTVLVRGGPLTDAAPGWTVHAVPDPVPDWPSLLAGRAPNVVVLRADPAGGELWREVPALVRAALAQGAARPRLVLAHHGAPLDAALGGYVRTLRRETPGWPVAFVESAGPVPLASLLAEAGAGEDVRLAAEGTRERPELVPLAAADAGSGAFRRGGRYLITGGLGGIGRRLTEHLVRTWAARVVLAGRTDPDAATRAWLAGWGGAVDYVRADLAMPGAAAEVVRAAAAHPAGLDGVVHAAGGLRDGPAAGVTAEDLAAALGPKAGAAEGLLAAARAARVPWVALFSSTAGVWGNPGQAAYAFANAALDAMAASSGSGPTRVVAIAWPHWAEGGMRATAAGRRLQEQLGLVPLPTVLGWELLASLLDRGESRVVVIHARPGRARELLAPPPPAVPPPAPAEVVPRPAPPVAGTPPPELLALLRAAAGRVLRLDPAQLEADVELGDYGFDSVTFTSLANELQRDLGLEVTPAAFFEHRTLQAVADHAWREAAEVLRPRLVPAGTPFGPAPAPMPEPAGEPSAPVVVETVPVRSPAPSAPADSPLAEPVAVIGMAGVFPGSPDLEAFWRHLAAGADLIGQPAPERWPDADRPWGGFIDGIDRFDARAFDISPREAELMDPQQRLFLQAVWHAFEDAGYRREDVAGTRTGLFAGVAAADYASLLATAGVAVEAYSSTGNAHSVLANRASYHFDLRGPSEAIDTACSSSLVAIHRALESLRGGSCTQAVVGGVNALLSPAGFTAFRRAGMLSPDHRCRSFDARANGYVRGEGVGVIVLKPLARARRDGDRIHGVILGSAENHGGRVQSLTVPNPVAQADLLVEAWARAGIDPATLGLLEAHGTGTALGDPIEFNGLKRAYAAAVRAGDRARCAIGAVKANLGHLETAAGIAGVLKVLLALRHRVIPGNPQLERLNPYVQPAGTPFHFPTRAEPWPAPAGPDGAPGPRRAGVSSFGFGGANAHVVLEEAPLPDPGVAPRPRLARREFARDRHWIPAPGPLPPATPPPASAVPAVPGLTPGEARVAWAAAEPVLAHHRVAGQPVLPGAAIATLLLAAGNSAGLKALAWLRPLSGGAEGVAARIRRGERPGAAGSVALLGEDGLERARADLVTAPAPVAPLDVAALRARCTRALPDAGALYPAFAARGLDYGPAYQALRRAWTDGSEVLAELALPAGWAPGWQPNPALLDAAFQAVALLPGTEGELALPSGVDELAVYGPWPETLVAWVRPASGGDPGARRYDLTLAAPDGCVVGRVNGYALRTARPTVPLAFLAPVWEPRPAPVAPAPDPGATCLFLGEDPVVVAGLRAAGWRPRVVRPGLAYQVEGDVTTVRPGVVGDYLLLLREAEPAAILHAWAAGDGGAAPERGPRAVHALVQALLRAGREACPLVFVHRGEAPLAAGVAAYFKAVRLEHPALRARTVVSPAVAAGHLAVAGAPEPDWREERGGWAARALVRREPPAPDAPPRGLVYLITGGRGGIGRRIAAELVRTEGARVVLVGRSPPAAGDAPWPGADPAEFLQVTADVSTAEGAAAAVAAARARFGRIDGVLHAAGVLRDGAAWRKEWDDFATVLRPKLAAAEALDVATRDEPLRCFVLFSSVAGLLGAAGQADYAFANGALDAFAAARAAAVAAGTRRGHTVTLNWPRWRDGGMPVPEGADALGLEPLSAADGWEILRQVRWSGEPQLWAFRGDATAVLRRLAPGPVASSPVPPAAEGDLMAELAGMFSALSKTPVAQLQPDVSLERHGLDSILAFEFSRRLSERFGEVTPAQLFAQPTLAGLAAFLTARATPPTAVSSAPVAARPPVAPAAVPAVGAARVRRQVTLAPADFAFAGPGRLAMEVLYRFDQRLDAAVLRRGLRAVAADYFPVNASLERRGGDDFVLREARDEPDFFEIVTPGRVPAEDDADGLANFREPFDPTRRGARMARFRLHQLDRGSALVVQVSHAVADGYSFYLFLAAWAAACRGEAHPVPDHSRHLLRTLARRLERRAGRQARVAAAIEAFAMPPSDADPTTRRVERLTLDPAALVAAARDAADGIPAAKLSENSVVTAHLWRHYAAALPPGDEPLVLACPMNFRRADGVVGPAFFGNASAPVFVRRSRDEVRAAGVPALAAALTDAVRGADERTLAAYHAAMDRVRRAGGPEAVRRLRLADPWGGLVVTNVARFPLPPLDFGTGPAADDVNLVHHAGTAVIVAGPGGTLKARVAYPASTGPAPAAP